VGLAIQICAVVVFTERFQWSWHLYDLQKRATEQTGLNANAFEHKPFLEKLKTAY
jgi:hypothetical protein